MDIKKAKQDSVYFVEHILGIELLDSQKELLRRYQNGEELIFTGGYMMGKRMVIDFMRDWYSFRD